MSDSFKDRYKVESYEFENNKRNKQRYTAQRGTAQRAARKPKRTNRQKIAGILAAIVLGGGAVGVLSHHNNDIDEQKLTDLIEQKEAVNKLGLSEQTLQTILDNKEYFENIDSINISGADILDKSAELRQLILDCAKEKTAFVTDREASDFKISYGFETGSEVETFARIAAEQDYKNNKPEISFSRTQSIIPGEQTMPKEMFDTIMQLEELENINNAVKERKMSVDNAIKQLKNVFEQTDKFCSYELIRNDKQLLAVSADEQIKNEQMQEERE